MHKMVIYLLAAATAFSITGEAVLNYRYNAEFVEPSSASSATRSTGEDNLYRHHEHGHHSKSNAPIDSFADENHEHGHHDKADAGEKASFSSCADESHEHDHHDKADAGEKDSFESFADESHGHGHHGKADAVENASSSTSAVESHEHGHQGKADALENISFGSCADESHEHSHDGNADDGNKASFSSFAEESHGLGHAGKADAGEKVSESHGHGHHGNAHAGEKVLIGSFADESNENGHHGKVNTRKTAILGAIAAEIHEHDHSGIAHAGEAASAGYGKENADSSADGQISMDIFSEYGIPDYGQYDEILEHEKNYPSGSFGDGSYEDDGFLADEYGYDRGETVDEFKGDSEGSMELPFNEHHKGASYKGETPFASPPVYGKKNGHVLRNGNGGTPGYPPE